VAGGDETEAPIDEAERLPRGEAPDAEGDALGWRRLVGRRTAKGNPTPMPTHPAPRWRRPRASTSRTRRPPPRRRSCPPPWRWRWTRATLAPAGTHRPRHRAPLSPVPATLIPAGGPTPLLLLRTPVARLPSSADRAHPRRSTSSARRRPGSSSPTTHHTTDEGMRENTVVSALSSLVQPMRACMRVLLEALLRAVMCACWRCSKNPNKGGE
jgi:hypothetical protein